MVVSNVFLLSAMIVGCWLYSRSKSAKLCKQHVIDVSRLYHQTGACLYEVLSSKIGRRVFWQSEIKKTTYWQS